ncbi:AAA family ATPase [Mycobacterium riyadhense]|uniref:AAA family ATPase n=1 Tax=Mycobacterium riyadhense TaxID=486698 RepID=UPI001956CCD5|nr:AAA family ATPase [Mycobacterium riyadhense]
MTDDLIARGKAIAESGKHKPTPNDLAARKGRPANNGGPIPLHPNPGHEHRGSNRSTHRRRERTARRTVDQTDPAPTLLSNVMTAADLDTMTFPDLVEHVPHLITEGFGVLAGSPKAGKSWLAAGIALACAHGGMALGCIPLKEHRHVLLLALEDGPRRLQTRMRRLNGDRSLPARLDILTEIAPGTVIPTITEWLNRHRDDDTQPLVILDTLGRARPQRRPGDDPYIADYQLGSRIKATVDAVPGAALVAVHHTRKMGAEDWLDTVSGTQGISGSADYVLVLRRKRKSDEGTLAVTGRDVAENEYAVKTDNGIWTLDGMDILDAAATITTRAEQAQQIRLGTRSLDAMKFVNTRPSTTPPELAEHLKVDSQEAGRQLKRLFDGGYVEKASRGVYVPAGGKTGDSGKNADQPPQANLPLLPVLPQD